MIMLEGQVYRCQNEQCGAEMQVTKKSIDGDSNPRCCCGAQMKKPYAKPTIRRVDPTPELMELFRGKSASVKP